MTRNPQPAIRKHQRPASDDAKSCADCRRRFTPTIRNRMSGRVGGRREQPRLLSDEESPDAWRRSQPGIQFHSFVSFALSCARWINRIPMTKKWGQRNAVLKPGIIGCLNSGLSQLRRVPRRLLRHGHCEAYGRRQSFRLHGATAAGADRIWIPRRVHFCFVIRVMRVICG